MTRRWQEGLFPTTITSFSPGSSRIKRSPKPRRKHQVNGCPGDAERDRLITTDSDGTYKRPPGVHNSAYMGCPVCYTDLCFWNGGGAAGGGVVSGRRGWSARCDGGARWLMLQGQLRWGQAWAAPLRRDLRAGAPGGALWRHIPIYKPCPLRREGAPLEVDLKTEKCPESFFFVCFFPSLGQRVV